MPFSQIVGFAGTALVALAYVPQIQHLIAEHCSAGVSLRAYVLWFLASLLFLAHALMIRDPVFVFVQILNLAAICIIVVFCRRYQNQMCLSHLSVLHHSQASFSRETAVSAK